MALPASTRRRLRRFVARGLDFFLPSDCFACGDPLRSWQHRGACATCWSSFRPVCEPFCRRCGLPAPEATDLLGPAQGTCAACVLAPGPLDAVRAAVIYDTHARHFLLRAKGTEGPLLFRPLARQLLAALHSSGLAKGMDCLAPAPSHPWSNLRRGFSPAAELARFLAAPLGLPVRNRLLSRRVLPWGGAKGLDRASRRRLLLGGSVFVRGTAQGARVLLIDDLMTTGATLEACSRALRASGAREIRAAVWARALPPGWSGPVSVDFLQSVP